MGVLGEGGGFRIGDRGLRRRRNNNQLEVLLTLAKSESRSAGGKKDREGPDGLSLLPTQRKLSGRKREENQKPTESSLTTRGTGDQSGTRREDRDRLIA